MGPGAFWTPQKITLDVHLLKDPLSIGYTNHSTPIKCTVFEFFYPSYIDSVKLMVKMSSGVESEITVIISLLS